MRAIQALSVVEVRKKKTILRSFAGLLALGRPSAWCGRLRLGHCSIRCCFRRARNARRTSTRLSLSLSVFLPVTIATATSESSRSSRRLGTGIGIRCGGGAFTTFARRLYRDYLFLLTRIFLFLLLVAAGDHDHVLVSFVGGIFEFGSSASTFEGRWGGFWLLLLLFRSGRGRG